jgi:hypothetical protein
VPLGTLRNPGVDLPHAVIAHSASHAAYVIVSVAVLIDLDGPITRWWSASSELAAVDLAGGRCGTHDSAAAQPFNVGVAASDQRAVCHQLDCPLRLRCARSRTASAWARSFHTIVPVSWYQQATALLHGPQAPVHGPGGA